MLQTQDYSPVRLAQRYAGVNNLKMQPIDIQGTICRRRSFHVKLSKFLKYFLMISCYVTLQKAN